MRYNQNYFDSASVKNKDKFEIYLNFLKDIVNIDWQKASICDIGCATSEFLEALGGNGNYVGVDVSEYVVAESRKKFPQLQNNFFRLDLNKEKPVWPRNFDAITLFDTIEHLNNFVYLKEMIKEQLKEKGFVVLTTPNANSLLRFLSLKSFTGEIDSTHTILFTPYTLDFFLRRLGLKKINLSTPYVFHFKNDFLTKRILLGGQIFAVYQK